MPPPGRAGGLPAGLRFADVGFMQAFQRTYVRFQEEVYVRTDGRLGHRLAVVPCLLLHTTGRKSGLRRTCVLLYVPDGRDRIVVASNYGGDRPPAWLLNAQADPGVDIQVAREKSAVTARVVEPGAADYDRLWALVNERNHQRYRTYQTRTTRPIPVVVLTPAGG